VFGGFTRYINTSLRDGFIYTQAQGHLTLFETGFLDEGRLDPASYLIGAGERERIEAILAQQPEVVRVAPQLQVSGMLSNGIASSIAVASGHVPSDFAAITAMAPGMLATLKCIYGRPMEDDAFPGVGVSSGLADLLDLENGDGAILVAPTVDGQINALDAEVFHTFDSPVEFLNDMLMVVPLAFAQSLYDTRDVDRLTVVLEDTDRTEAVKARLERLFAQEGLDLEIRTWTEMSLLYRKVQKMFDIIFLFLFVIVLVISLMSVINTINMAVMERTREIGTLRALGMRRARIVTLFALESGVLGVLGSLLGAMLTLAAWAGVAAARPTWVPPIITQRIPLEIHLVPEYLALSVLFLLALAVGAATFPARRAAAREIVDALGHA
jgi:putative ABC transport system permease protein